MSLSLGGCPANSTLFFLLPLLFPEGRSRGLPLVNSLFLLLQFTKLWYISTPIGPSLEWRGCPTERSSHLINITLCKSKPLVSLLGGVGGVPPTILYNSFLLISITIAWGGVQGVFPWLILFSSCFFHSIIFTRHLFSSKEGGPGGIPLGIQLFLILQITKSLYIKQLPFFFSLHWGVGGCPPILLYQWSLPGHFSLPLASI